MVPGREAPLPARQLPSGTILVEEPGPAGRAVLYARVSSIDQRADLERQVERLRTFAQAQGWQDLEVVAEIGSGQGGKRWKLLRILKDPAVGRTGTAWPALEAALYASGKRLVVVEKGEVVDDLVRDLLEILTSARGRLYGRRSARNRAKRALEVMGCG